MSVLRVALALAAGALTPLLAVACGSAPRSPVACGSALRSPGACGSAPRSQAPAPRAWEPVVCATTRAAIERIRCGRPDARDPRPQAVSVDQAGDVLLVRFGEGPPRARRLLAHGLELTGLVVGDCDPAVPGEEIYVGGAGRGPGGEEQGGIVLQIVLDATGPGEAEPRVRTLLEPSGYVHSLERIDPQRAGEPPSLLVGTYAGELHRLEPRDGRWSARLLHREPDGLPPEARRIKDAGFLREPGDAPRHVALVALGTGRLLRLDLEQPAATRLVHEEPGGLARVTPDREGGAYVIGYLGRVLHVTREAEGVRVEPIADEGLDSGLRGLVLGRFPTEQGRAELALFGFHKLCRALVPTAGGLAAVTLFRDVERGHALEAAELVEGNEADELLLGGYSRELILLVRR